MARRGAWVLVLAAGLLAGCVGSAPGKPGTWIKRLRPAHSAVPTAAFVQIDVALLERPIGDAFLNKELWSYCDEQVVSLDRRAVLEDNGFRVGQIVGMPPGKFQDLLTSERSCVNPERLFREAGKLASYRLGPARPAVSFQSPDEGLEVVLEQAQHFLDVIPTLTEDGRTRLRFIPKIEHGEVMRDVRATAAGLTLEVKRPSKTVSGLSWEVVLAPNDYLVIGAVYDKRRSLGYGAFIDEDERFPAQRLLVIRTNRSAGPSEEEPLPTLEELARTGTPPPLALQATLTTVRGASP